MYGCGVLLEDEQNRALTLLDATQCRLNVDDAIREVEFLCRTTDEVDRINAAVDKMHQVKAQQGEGSGSVPFSAWALFALEHDIQPANDSAAILASKEKASDVRQRKQQGRDHGSAHNRLWWSTFAAVVSGAYLGVWMFADAKKKRLTEAKEERCCLISILFVAAPVYIALGMAVFLSPWYLAVDGTWLSCRLTSRGLRWV
jgi:hypothetical protein